MAFFEINGREWPIAEGSQEDPEERIGGSVRTITGQLRWRVRARLRSWSLRTAELTFPDMADLLDELRGPGTLNITGEWFNAVCRAEIGAEGPVPGDAGFFVLDFRLVEIGEVVGPQLPEDPEEQMELEQELAALSSGLITATTLAENSTQIQGVDALALVGPGGSFATINSALEVLSRLRTLYKNQGINVELRLRSGFVMAEQVIVRRKDLSWITITSEDGQVTIDRSALTISLASFESVGNIFPAFAALDGGLPTIGALFDMNTAGTASNRYGVLLRQSRATILPGCGVINAAARGLEVATSSTCWAQGSVWSGAGELGVRVSNSSVAVLREATMDNCQSGLHVGGGCVVQFSAGSAQNAANAGVASTGPCLIQLVDTDVSGAGGFGVELGTNGNGPGGTIQATGVTGTFSHRANILTALGIIFASDRDTPVPTVEVAPPNTQNSTYTFVRADAGKVVRAVNHAGIVYTVPSPNPWPQGGVVDVQNGDTDSVLQVTSPAGAITFRIHTGAGRVSTTTVNLAAGSWMRMYAVAPNVIECWGVGLS